MTRYAKRKLKYSLNENFNLLPYVEWDRFVTLTGAQAEWGLRYRIYVTPNCISFSLSNSRFILTFRYMTYQLKRNPNTMPVSKIICTCTTIFLKFYNKCVNKTNLATIHRHVNIFFITSYFTLSALKSYLGHNWHAKMTMSSIFHREYLGWYIVVVCQS